MCVPMWVYGRTCLQIPVGPEEDMRCPGFRATGACELPDVGAGSWTRVSVRAVSAWPPSHFSRPVHYILKDESELRALRHVTGALCLLLAMTVGHGKARQCSQPRVPCTWWLADSGPPWGPWQVPQVSGLAGAPSGNLILFELGQFSLPLKSHSVRFNNK